MLLKNFIGKAQISVMRRATRGEEGQFFLDKLESLSELVGSMPKVYEQDGKGEDAIIYLHYFKGGCDWYITERDTTEEQHQAFGMADIGYGGELGYISIQELIENGVELDLHWKPKPLKEINAMA